jgi:hypothetical protein
MGAMFLTMSVGLAVLSILFGAEILPLLQPAIPTLLASAGKMANLAVNLNTFRLIMGILAEATLESIPLVYRVVLPLGLAGLAAFWIFSLHRLNVRRIKKGVVS